MARPRKKSPPRAPADRGREVRILTFFGDLNFGQQLQNYALTAVLQKLGCQVRTLCWHEYNYTTPGRLPQTHAFMQSFRARHIPSTLPLFTERQLREACAMEDGLILMGGDQVFRNWEGDHPCCPVLRYFGDFVTGRCTLASYAASFGHDHLDVPHETAELLAGLLTRFDRLGVRESSGVDIIRSLGATGVQVCDPVLLLPSERWQRLTAAGRAPGRNYVAAMILGPDPRAGSAIEPILRPVLEPRRLWNAFYAPDGNLAEPEQWLTTLRHADAVITNSFHTVVFALLFRRPFICVPAPSGGLGRLQDLLSGLGLDRRIRHGLTEIVTADLEDDISWNEVHHRLEAERARGLAFLQEVLALPATDKDEFALPALLQETRRRYEAEYERRLQEAAPPPAPLPVPPSPGRLSTQLLSELAAWSGACGAHGCRIFGRGARRVTAHLPAALTAAGAEEGAAAELALVCGALEYEADPAAAAGEITAAKPQVILLAYPECGLYPDVRRRRQAGWVNDLTKDDLIALFTARDYMVSRYALRADLGAVLLELRSGRCHSVQHHALCCGCTACTHHCPRQAITMGPDEDGFFRALVDPQRCGLCGRCSRACPIIHPRFPNDPHPTCLAFESDPQRSSGSSTAGGFQILARHFLARGGLVAGAAWTADGRGGQTAVRHELIASEEELGPLLGSKYVQSELGGIFARVRAALDEGREVLFSGVPCQVAGLYATLGRKRPGLHTVETICNHVPSQRWFHDYLCERYGAGTVRAFDFRARADHLPTTQNTAVTLSCGQQLLLPQGREPYAALFVCRAMMPEFCENCRFAGVPRQADLTLGDFWGLERHAPAFRGRGHSGAALINNERGRALAEIITAQASRVAEVDAQLLWQANRTPAMNSAHPRRSQLRERVRAGRGLLTAALDLQLVPLPDPLLLPRYHISKLKADL